MKQERKGPSPADQAGEKHTEKHSNLLFLLRNDKRDRSDLSYLGW